MRSRTLLFYLILALVLIGTDQIVKALVETRMAMHEQIDLLPFFALFRTHNTGIAFSMFSSFGAPALVVLTLGVVLFVSVLALRTASHHTAARLGFAFIIGGAIGNLIDRVSLGYVVDYFLFHTPSWSFAVFNLADAYITVGAGLVLLQEVLDYRRERSTAREKEE
ncbi:MAG TPA: signal peptidase II [Tianweitania sediminis]|jgi:signal peptidase II|nr:signal peptidase II [Tianweitania sediminis]